MISWFEKHNKISWAITILIAIAIFYISSLTFESIGGSGGIGYKALAYHILMFFLFGFFLTIAIAKGKYESFILLATILALIYGISDELHQFFVPGRIPALSDVALDFIGISIASTLYLISIEYRDNTT